MKTATTTPAAVYVNCPHCGESVDEPMSGSQMWTEYDMPKPGTVMTCYACGERFKAPAFPKARRAVTTR